MGSQEEIFYVEDILNERIKNGKLEYHIKWEGFGMEDCTWEPAKNIFCNDVIKKFKKRLKKEEKEKATRAKNECVRKRKKNPQVSKAKASSVPDNDPEVTKKVKKPQLSDTPKPSSVTSDCAGNEDNENKTHHPPEVSKASCVPDNDAEVTKKVPISSEEKLISKEDKVNVEMEDVSIIPDSQLESTNKWQDVESTIEELFSNNLSQSVQNSSFEYLKQLEDEASTSTVDNEISPIVSQNMGDVSTADSNSIGNDNENVNEKESQIDEDSRNGFEKGWSCKKLIGGVKRNGKIWFIVKYKDQTQVEMLPSKVCSAYCPLKVISFYERRLSWNTVNQETAMSLESEFFKPENEEAIFNAQLQTENLPDEL